MRHGRNSQRQEAPITKAPKDKGRHHTYYGQGEEGACLARGRGSYWHKLGRGRPYRERAQCPHIKTCYILAKFYRISFAKLINAVVADEL